MLRGKNDLLGSTVSASDGIVGHVKDFYFDDEAWVVRYLIVETGDWLSRRKVLLSPRSIGTANWDSRTLPVSMTRERVRRSPAIDTDKPVSRQQEEGHLDYYGLPAYWILQPVLGTSQYPHALPSGLGYGGAADEYRAMEARHEADVTAMSASAAADPHLRSCTEVVKYHVHATDGDIGHVQDLLLEEATWSIRYLVVDTSNWRLGHHVRIAPQRIERVSWPSERVFVDLTRREVSDARGGGSQLPRARGQEPDLEENVLR